MMSLPWIQSLLDDESRTGCRDWPFKSLTEGYPVVKLGGRKGRIVRVSNIVLCLDGRPQRRGQEALHSCDRPICCAPWHLRWGTRHENIQDSIRRGRWPAGERQYAARLTNAQAEAIRQDPRKQAEIAAAYGIGQPQVSRIKNGLIYV